MTESFDKYPPATGFPDDSPDDITRQDADGKTRRYLRLFGEFRHLSAWAKLYGMTRFVLCQRLAEGWSIEKAITQPIMLSKMKRRLRKLRDRAEINEIVYVHQDGSVKRIFRKEKLSPENIKAVREAGAEVQKLMRGVGMEKMREILEKEFGEKKVAACRRLMKEQRYEPFRTVCKIYKTAFKTYPRLSLPNHLIFYLALEHFPPKDEFADL